ncbi:MAG: CHASE2 domain-containing protein [Microscillaceae bacterium]|nr:CHASE2 domain-containing protein [Microscillaceae bacterium]
MMSKYLYRTLFSILHGLILSYFTWFWLNQPFTFGQENILIQTSAIFSKLILGQDTHKPPSDSLVFIHVGDDKMLMEVEDGKKTIFTDRTQLAKFFEILNRHPQDYRYVICDILFEDPTPDDHRLKKAIEQTDRMIAAGLSAYCMPRPQKAPLFDISYGLVEYVASSEGNVFKFKLSDSNHCKSLPLKMYEDIYQTQFYENTYGYHFIEDQLSLNALVIDYKIRNHDIYQKRMYKYISLYRLLNLLEAHEHFFWEEFLKDRIIVLGDFEKDYIQSSFGELSGSLMLLNVYLALVNQENIIPLSLIIFLILCYSLISYFLFYKPVFRSRLLLERFRKSSFVKNFAYLCILIGVSLCTYLIYKVPVNILIIVIYLEIMACLIKIRRQRKTFRDIAQSFKRYFLIEKANLENYNKHTKS